MSARGKGGRKSAPDSAKPHRASPARDLAWSAVLAALERRTFISDLLSERKDAADLSPRDAALASTIARSALRHGATIDAVLSSVADYEPRRVPPGLRAVLHVAATQILYLDRIPVSAAVNEAVSQARRVESAAGSRMVNALLRRLTGAIAERRTAWLPDRFDLVRVSWGEACRFDREVFRISPDSGDELTRLAAMSGTPHALLAELRPHVSPADLAAVAWASQAQPPLVLHRNPQRLDAAGFEAGVRAALAEADADSVEIAAAVEFAGAAAFVRADESSRVLALLRDGNAYAQDATAHAISLELRPTAGEKILDYCAAPGGKSLTLAFATGPDVSIVATDISAARLRPLRQQVELHGLSDRIRVCSLDKDGRLIDDDARPFDAAIVDVPCSNTGVLARRPEARLRIDAAHTRSLRTAQLEALCRAARVVRVGGRMIYSTCSIQPAENGELVRAWLRRDYPAGEENPGAWALVRERLHLPRWGARLSDWRDGGYFAELVRGS